MEILFLTRTAGSYMSAGLPNITGGASEFFWKSYSPSGAFVRSEYKDQHGGIDNDNDGWFYSSLYFDASRSNAIYGNSNTVQPTALTVRFYIKF